MGVYSKHVVEIETRWKKVGGEKVEDSKKQIDQLGRGVTKTTTEMTKYDKKGNEIITTTEKNIKGFERFQMEHLGVMFAGMALNRAMANLNATSREWLGIGELTSTMMGITMLDANIDLLEYGVLPLFEALTNLPPGAQKAIGHTTMALEGLGGVMMVGGQLALGLSSTLLVLEKMGGVGGAAAGATKALKGLAGISLIGIGVTLGISSILSEGGTSLMMGIGSAIASGLGAILLGASLTTGIVVSGIALATIVAVKMIVEDIEMEKDLRQRMEAKLYETATPMEQVLRGFSPTGGQGTMINFGNEYGQRDEKLNSILNYENALGQKENVTINQVNNIEVADLNEFQRMIDQNNSSLINDMEARF